MVGEAEVGPSPTCCTVIYSDARSGKVEVGPSPTCCAVTYFDAPDRYSTYRRVAFGHGPMYT